MDDDQLDEDLNDEFLTTQEYEGLKLTAPEVVSCAFVDALELRYGLRRRSEPDLRLLRFLTLAPWREGNSDRIVLPNRLLAELTDRQSTQFNENLRGNAYLEKFAARIGFAIDIEPWNGALHRARTVRIRLPIGLKELLEQEAQLEWYAGGLRWLEGMRLLNRANRQVLRTQMQEHALLSHPAAHCSVASRWLKYLNRLPSNRFSTLLGEMEYVRTEILSNTSGLRRKQALRVLGNIWVQPQPFYRPTKNSVRLYGTCENLTALSKEWRKLLAPDWIDADLRNCYLAIGAELWDIPLAREFLATGQSVWKPLCEAVRVEFNEENKKVLKRVFYGLFFGMLGIKRKKILYAFGAEADKRFTRFPLVEAILQARREQTKKIVRDRGATDCFDRKLSTRSYKVRSIHAQMMQAVEMKLLEPALELFETERGTHGATCVLMQHDGFSFVPHDRNDANEWMVKLQAAVQARAQALGVNTALVFDHPLKN